eukprot:6174139-Pleurochrysis_carterae.AAC.1
MPRTDRRPTAMYSLLSQLLICEKVVIGLGRPWALALRTPISSIAAPTDLASAGVNAWSVLDVMHTMP